MDDIDRLTRQIHELQGSMLAMECFVNSLTEALSSDARVVVQAFYASESPRTRWRGFSRTLGRGRWGCPRTPTMIVASLPQCTPGI